VEKIYGVARWERKSGGKQEAEQETVYLERWRLVKRMPAESSSVVVGGL
jgi:hypothetical protein